MGPCSPFEPMGPLGPIFPGYPGVPGSPFSPISPSSSARPGGPKKQEEEVLWSQLSPVGLQRGHCEGNHRDLCWAVGEWRPLPTKQAWLPLLSACVHPPSPGPSRCFLHGVAVCPSPAVPEHHPCLITPQRALYKVVSAVPLSPQPRAFHHVLFFFFFIFLVFVR